MVRILDSGGCYLWLIRPCFREEAWSVCSRWPTVEQVFSLPVEWFEDRAFLHRVKIVELGYFHVVEGTSSGCMLARALMTLPFAKRHWPDDSLAANIIREWPGAQYEFTTLMTLSDRLGGETRPSGFLSPPVSPAELVSKSKVTRGMVSNYYAAYKQYLDAQLQSFSVASSSVANSVDDSVGTSSSALTHSSVSVNSSASSGRARRRARRRKRKAEQAKRNAKSVDSVASDSTRLTYSASIARSAVDRSREDGHCYAPLFADASQVIDILGKAPTFREVLRLQQRMLPLDKIRMHSVERTGPGMYHLSSRGPSVVHTFAMLVEQDVEFASSGFRGMHFPAILRDKVKLDDRLGVNLQGIFRRMHLGEKQPVIGPMAMPQEFMILPVGPVLAASDSIFGENGEEFEGRMETIADWRQNEPTGVEFRSCATAFTDMPDAWLTFAIHNEQPNEPIAVALLAHEQMLIRESGTSNVQSIVAGHRMWLIVHGQDLVFSMYWSSRFESTGLIFHVMRKFCGLSEMRNLPIGRILPVELRPPDSVLSYETDINVNRVNL